MIGAKSKRKAELKIVLTDRFIQVVLLVGSTYIGWNLYQVLELLK